MNGAVTATIITLNEEVNIGRCLESLNWADDIVVVDSGSGDATLDICRGFNCRIYNIDWRGFGATKQFALEQAGTEWVLSIDADEEVSDALRQQIKDVINDPASLNGYKIQRCSRYLGSFIRHSGWEHDRPLRLLRKSCGRFDLKSVHESIHLQGPAGLLKAPLYHYPYPDISTHIDKMNRYSELGAQELAKKGRNSSPAAAVLHGTGKFLKMYLLKAGFLDGAAGFVLAKNSAFGVYLKYIKLWKMNR
ncbi:MAG: glycosyltransferase family 2 protein [candidate division KSB1 bacterium]|nr:glycosyltransferase family 2 protein [candidate division KSB1 bacterium]